MAINMTLPANLLVKSMTQGIFSYHFFQNMKAFAEADVISSSPDAIFQLDYQSLEDNAYEGEFIDRMVLNPITNLWTRLDYANGGNSATILTMASRNDAGVFFEVKAGPLNLGRDAGRVSIAKQERLIQEFVEQAAKRAKVLIQQYLFGIANASISAITAAA